MKNEDFLKGMASDIRCDIVRFLEAHGRATVSQIKKFIDIDDNITQSAISQHLMIMRRSRIVNVERDKTFRYYSLANELPYKMVELLDQY